MSATTTQLERQQEAVSDLLREAVKQGASAAEAGVSSQKGLAVTVRLGETETIEHTNDHGLGVTVFFGKRKGSASTTDLSPQAIRESVAAACRIARYTSEDPHAGLADADDLATEVADLDLHHPWDINATEAAALALECETAARDEDSRISNSEGASLHTGGGSYVYGNSHGFLGGYASSRHSLSCAVVAGNGDGMQRDYWYSNACLPGMLDSAGEIGRTAARRTLARLDSQKLSTRRCPVIFRAEIAPGLMRSLFRAISGPALYQQASFLLDQLGEAVFPDWVTISEDPLLPQGLGSAPFDNEGVATRAKNLVGDGVLESYLLDSYSARKMGMQTTANAGGVHNARITSSGQTLDELLALMDSGLLVTEVMGQGTNTVTGDYSRGAAGFWVEHGKIAYPVEEITIAGNLRDMFRGLQAVGNDDRIPGSTRTGSWLIDSLTVAGS